jgi:hypothetical protein
MVTLFISRLLLNLRNVSTHTQWSAETDVRGLGDMRFAPRSDLDTAYKPTVPVSSTGFTNSTRLTDVLEWLEEEEAEREEPDFNAEARRAGKRKQSDSDIEIVNPVSYMEMGPIRSGTT